MAICAVMKISTTEGESNLAIGSDKQKWIEVQSWDWEIEAETSWTKGGGASVGKPNPGKMNWSHYFDKSSLAIMRYICSGAAFETVELRMFKGTGAAAGTAYVLGSDGTMFYKMVMKGAFITKVKNAATEEGNIQQDVEMVFKEVTIDYSTQDSTGKEAGALKNAGSYSWDIPGGKVS